MHLQRKSSEKGHDEVVCVCVCVLLEKVQV